MSSIYKQLFIRVRVIIPTQFSPPLPQLPHPLLRRPRQIPQAPRPRRGVLEGGAQKTQYAATVCGHSMRLLAPSDLKLSSRGALSFPRCPTHDRHVCTTGTCTCVLAICHVASSNLHLPILHLHASSRHIWGTYLPRALSLSIHMNNMKLALVLALALLPSLAHGDTSADCTVMSDIYGKSSLLPR